MAAALFKKSATQPSITLHILLRMQRKVHKLAVAAAAVAAAAVAAAAIVAAAVAATRVDDVGARVGAGGT